MNTLCAFGIVPVVLFIENLRVVYYYSDLISLDRSLKDVRREECKKVKYDLHNLPSVSMLKIFIFDTRHLLLLFSLMKRGLPFCGLFIPL